MSFLRAWLTGRRLWTKILLHGQLADLGVQFLDLGLAILLPTLPLARKNLGQALLRLALPLGDHDRVDTKPGRQLGHRLLALQRLQRHLGLELP